jgi:hypothetical protein
VSPKIKMLKLKSGRVKVKSLCQTLFVGAKNPSKKVSCAGLPDQNCHKSSKASHKATSVLQRKHL